MTSDHPEAPSADAGSAEAAPAPKSEKRHAAAARAGFVGLALGALGVVYGDIGTSPLYAVRECFHTVLGVPLTPANVLGVLSLVFWALLIVVVVKYLTFVMRADNHGEGGILALLALVAPKGGLDGRASRRRNLFIVLGLFGAALLGADGIITPAISVLSAVEGLQVATPAFRPLIVPLSVLILVALFLVQKRGTAGVGAVFGPAMLVWFVTIGLVGVPWILEEPRILGAVNPLHIWWFFRDNGWQGFSVLGAIVLCITGTEALYADLGHFGRWPIRIAWYTVVYPGLLLNYFGQGAALLARGQAVRHNPFYSLVSGWALYPMVVLATVATVIASQALISGAYSLAQQAVQLGYSPRLTITHTSSRTRGQIYVPQINTWLMVACVAVVVGFRESTHLAAAYGVAVMGTMTITSLLLFAVAHRRWGWPLWKAAVVVGLFLCVDLVFLTANVTKVFHGALFPLVVSGVLFTIMITWKRGRAALAKSLLGTRLPIERFLESLAREQPVRVKGTAVFMTSNPDGTPVVMLHHVKHNKVLHETVVLLCILTEEIPEVPAADRVTVRDLGQGFHQVVARYGFMQNPNVPEVLRCCEAKGLKVVPEQASFYLGRETLLVTQRPGLSRWAKALFAYLSRNARNATAFFGIPPGRVVEIGAQIEL